MSKPLSIRTFLDLQEYGGTGLGLSISKRLVSLMNGSMWVESELSKGSKFFFTIQSQISISSIESVLAKMQPFQKRTILFVDTLSDRTGVTSRINELGLKPHPVRDVMEVADKEHCPHIDTILVDSLSMVRPRSSKSSCKGCNVLTFYCDYASGPADGANPRARASEIHPNRAARAGGCL